MKLQKESKTRGKIVTMIIIYTITSSFDSKSLNIKSKCPTVRLLVFLQFPQAAIETNYNNNNKGPSPEWYQQRQSYRVF